jgi:hypothetical protein
LAPEAVGWRGGRLSRFGIRVGFRRHGIIGGAVERAVVKL